MSHGCYGHRHAATAVAALVAMILAGCGTIGQAPAPTAAPAAPAPAPPAKPEGANQDAKAPIADSTTPPPVQPAPPKTAPPKPSPAKPAPAPLDLKALEQRLRDTPAIGVFTKLALKNQVDDLLDGFRAHYQGRPPPTLTELRQPYERLLLKVLSLLQDTDPALARDIVASREAIWGVLSDRNKFNSLI